jgi:hypothetical protein
VDLVEALPDSAAQDPQAPPLSFVVVTQDSLPRVQMMRAILEDEGIPAHIDNEESHSMMQLQLQSTVAVRLLVPADQVEAAREILSIKPEPKEEGYTPAREARWIGCQALLGFCFPPFAFLALANSARWLKYNGKAPGHGLVICSVAASVLCLFLWLCAALFWMLLGQAEADKGASPASPGKDLASYFAAPRRPPVSPALLSSLPPACRQSSPSPSATRPAATW